MNTEYYCPEWMLKRAAKRLSRQTRISHVGALDELAIELGFRDWADLKYKGTYVPTDASPLDWLSETTNKLGACFS